MARKKQNHSTGRKILPSLQIYLISGFGYHSFVKKRQCLFKKKNSLLFLFVCFVTKLIDNVYGSLCILLQEDVLRIHSYPFNMEMLSDNIIERIGGYMNMSSLCHSNHKPCACFTFITSSIILKMIHVPLGSLTFSFLHVLLPPNGSELNCHLSC